MNPILKNILGILILLIIVLVTVGLLFNNLTKKSFYEESGEINVRGISNRVNIYKTELGVSHIFAENEEDMYFSLGYTHAQDRLWQMDLSRRVAEGKLSEIFGIDLLDYDILFRTIGIDQVVLKQYDKLSQKTRSVLEAYTRGVNSFMEENSSNLPLEFDILNYKPDPWKPEHSLELVKLMGWELNLSWYTDLMFAEIVKKFGYEKAKDFFPDYPEDAPFIVNNESQGKPKSDSLNKAGEKNKSTGYNYFKDPTRIENYYSSISDKAHNFFKLSKDFRTLMGTEGTHVGSNSWVISGSRSESGKPLLANDPHLALLTPSKWYEVSLYDNQKKYSVCGFTLPGVPAVAIGHNNVVSWGLTNLMCDDTDFFILKKDSADSNKYIYKNRSEFPDSSVQNIKIKDVADEYIFTVYTTLTGPVISSLEKTGFTGNQKFRNDNTGELLTFRWTGYEISDELDAFYNINNAKNWDEFQNALKTYSVPALNFVYADTMGNIGYHAAGYIPIRSNSGAGFPGINEIDQINLNEWTGFIPFDELPKSLNPAEGYIVTANNKPLKNFSHYISNLYEPPYRAERIKDIINSNPVITENEMKIIQRDVYSLQAKEFCEYLFSSFGDSTNLTEDIKAYLDLLKNWDFEFKVNSIPATLFAQFEIELYKNLYKDQLGDELFENYIFTKNIPVRNTSRLLKLNSCSIFENDFAKVQLIRKSFYDAVSALIQNHGQDVNNWQWGNFHTIVMDHPLGIIPALNSMLNIGPFRIGGSGTTVNNLEYSFSKALSTGEFKAYLGPSMRMITDMSDVKTYLSIIPTGQSGQPLHRNYNDQARLWLNGDYKEVSTDFEDLSKENLKLLVMMPLP
ncbi:MAG TPA: penicillin acylase family protein [Ignavibacteria bacterium]|mgnify:CR=1 FL=1|nr:penicillin acylase family protein [Ignavibacteria bacterium]